MNIALVEPEIPQNTGNIARTCAAFGARLHLVRPLGFILSNRKLRRAGADYWGDVDLVVHDNLGAFFRAVSPERCFFFTTKAGRHIHEISPNDEDYLVFGRESTGLPADLIAAHPDHCCRIPMKPGARSLNLSNAVAIVLFEALRLRGFPGLA